MGIAAFVLRQNLEPVAFLREFLDSPDFDLTTLRPIARAVGTASGGDKRQLAHLIVTKDAVPDFERIIMNHLVGRKKKWISIKTGRVTQVPTLADPTILLYGDGQEEWYGPLSPPGETNPVYWYIRPLFIPHIERDAATNEFQQFRIRWLCYARVTEQTLSLHWTGFGYSLFNDNDATTPAMKKQTFPYWQYIPNLFDEIETQLNANVTYVNLHDLVLHELWERYRNDTTYRWDDQRIRAESSGMTLSAQAGVIVEQEVNGITTLAQTIRRSIERELQTMHDQQLPDPSSFDSIILGTLIREYGTLSYGFRLAREQQTLFCGHSYFGSKHQGHTADRFPHINVFISEVSDIDLLNFVLDHIPDER